MRNGYSENLYGLLRRFFKLPRPTEIWGNKVQNKWTLLLIYFYGRMCIGEAMSHLYFPLGVIQLGVTILTYLAVKDVPLEGFVILFGIVVALIGFVVGHILIVIGMMKKQNQLQMSQNPDILEIRNNVRKLVNETEKK